MGQKEAGHDMGQFRKWSILRACFGMRGGHSSWPKEQDRRSFLLGQTVECSYLQLGACKAPIH